MADEHHVGAIDQGTTGTRFCVVDADGRIVGSAYERHEQYYPEPGWVEHDAAELWTRTERVIRDGLDDAGVAGDDLAAIGVTNQRETTVLWDRETGEPVERAIVWQDRRTADRVEALEEAGHEEPIRETTGLQLDPYFSATKLAYLLDERGHRAAAERGDLAFGTVDSWLLWNLTGVHATDVTNASRTMLFDVADCAWSDAMLELFDVPRAVLPTVEPSSHPSAYGTTDPDGPVGAAVPVAGVLGDQQAALVGQGCVRPGMAKNTVGTGAFLLTHTGTVPARSESGLLTTVAYQLAGEEPRYALEGSVFVAGAAIDWLESVGLVDDVAETERLVEASAPSDDLWFVPAFSGLGAPHWDPGARGTVLGIDRDVGRGDLVRALVEGVAFRVGDVARAMEADAGTAVEEVRVDGGASVNDALCRLMADAVDAPVRRPRERETTALGAAYAAGIAVDVWEDEGAIERNREEDAEFAPDGADAMARRYERWLEAVERSGDWA